MGIQFTNKKILLDFTHTGEEIELAGNVRIDDQTKNVDNVSGSILKLDQEAGNTKIGEFSLMNLTIYSMENIRYRTKASTMLDEVMVQAQTDSQSQA